MLKTHQKSVKKQTPKLEGCDGTFVQWLWSKFDGVPTFSMRRFTVEPNGFIPLHKHPYEHEIYILSGKGTVFSEKEELPSEEGDTVYIHGDEQHGYKNPNSEPFIFLCVIPNSGDPRERRYYTHEDLKKEGKKACVDCIYSGNNKTCTLAYAVMLQPEECYYNINGNVLGCEYGCDRSERI